MPIHRIAFALALVLPGAYGQTFAQPVREVDREARSAVVGRCFTTVAVGNQSSPFTPCSLRSITGTNLGSGAPAGKILVIEDASARCSRSSSDPISNLALTINTGDSIRVIPLATQGTNNGITSMAGFTSGRAYYFPQQSVLATLTMRAFVAQTASCTIFLSGHLIDAQ